MKQIEIAKCLNARKSTISLIIKEIGIKKAQ